MASNQPPIFYTRLFRWFCREDLRDELEGDLEETFYINIKEHGAKSARRIYRREVVQLIRPSVIKKTKIEMNSPNLLFHYLKTSLRNLQYNKVSSIISLTGLTLGIATSALIFQFNKYEESYDAFHENGNQIYRLQNNVISNTTGEVLAERAATFYGAGITITDELQEVENATTVWDVNGILTYKNQPVKEDEIFFANAGFFEMFSFPLVSGNPSDLDEPGVIFLSESLAAKIFKGENPVGKSIEYDGLRTNVNHNLQVRGVFKDIPANSFFQTNALVSMAQLHAHHVQNSPFGGRPFDQYIWRWNEFYTFIQTSKLSTPSQVEEKVNQYFFKYRQAYDESNGRSQKILLQPLTDIHLRPGLYAELGTVSDRKVVAFFYLIAVLILLIAWINYINMSTAVAVKRAREVGVRKVLGAVRGQLVTQFILESLVINILAMILATALIALVIPFFHGFIGKEVFSLLPQMTSFWILTGISLLFGATLAGFYPAIVLSSFRPAQVLKASMKYMPQGILLRKGLVVFQFMIATFLLSGAIAVQSQLNFMLEQDPGFDIKQTMIIDTPPGVFRDSTYQSRINTLVNIATQFNGVQEVTVSSLIPGAVNRWAGSAGLANNPDQESVYISRMSMDSEFINAYGLDVIAGRGFQKSMRGDVGNSALLNLTGARNLGYSDPEQVLGQLVSFSSDEDYKIIGVVNDYNQNDMHSAVEPMLLQLDSTRGGQYLSVNFTGNPSGLIEAMTLEYNSLFPRTPFDFNFLDDAYEAQYEEDQMFQKIFNFFTAIAVFIACLGLLGLSMFLVNQKRKEVSIRKVLGASQSLLLKLLLKEYWQLISVAAVLTLPLAYYVVDGWLDNFAFRTNLTVWVFVLPVFLLGAVVFITVSQSTFSLLRTNPVENLRND